MTHKAPLPKFMFDAAFDAAKTPKQPKTYLLKEEELAAHKQVSFIDGVASGQRKALESIEANTLILIETIQSNLQQLLVQETQKRDQIFKESLEIAKTVASKIAIGTIQEVAITQVDAVLSTHLKSLKDHPQVKVTVHPDLVDPLKVKWVSSHLTIEGDDRVSTTDCQIHWGDGGIERSLQRILSQINTTIVSHEPSVDTSNTSTKEDIQ